MLKIGKHGKDLQSSAARVNPKTKGNEVIKGDDTSETRKPQPNTQQSPTTTIVKALGQSPWLDLRVLESPKTTTPTTEEVKWGKGKGKGNGNWKDKNRDKS